MELAALHGQDAGVVGRQAVIDLSEYTYETVRAGPEFILRRARPCEGGCAYLTVEPSQLIVEPLVLKQLEDEHKLCTQLGSTSFGNSA